jgi:hypothetical protein
MYRGADPDAHRNRRAAGHATALGRAAHDDGALAVAEEPRFGRRRVWPRRRNCRREIRSIVPPPARRAAGGWACYAAASGTDSFAVTQKGATVAGTKRPSFLKRQKEQKRMAKAQEKRETRRMKKQATAEMREAGHDPSMGELEDIVGTDLESDSDSESDSSDDPE